MKKLMAANWKMHKVSGEAREVASGLMNLVAANLPEDREVLITPTATCLAAVAEVFASDARFSCGAQNFYPEKQGAFTGELSVDMIKDAGASFALAGHSERRHIFGESDDLVGKKVVYGLDNGLSMIMCIGELIEERKAGKVEEVLSRQLRVGLADVPKDVDPARLTIAYEPVWAIGTGMTAGPNDVLEAHAFVRKELEGIFGAPAREMRIQYGGSVKPDNISELIVLDNVDGVLVGGASLQAESFSKIVLG